MNTEHNRVSLSHRLRRLLTDPEILFLMGAHDGLSATLAARSGFDALWASGFSISTTLGYRDSNEASATEVLHVVERIVECSGVPVLVDGDTGFGDFNSARIFARRVERVGAAGLCIEDKRFPKMNSFRDQRQEIASKAEFCGKLRAIKDVLNEPSFVLVARTEALVHGLGVEAALDRCRSYVNAGADAVVVHSKAARIDDIEEFFRLWRSRAPVILIPTTYSSVPTKKFNALKVNGLIWANHGVRAVVKCLRETYSHINEKKSVSDIEDIIATMEEIFELLEYNQLDSDLTLYQGD